MFKTGPFWFKRKYFLFKYKFVNHVMSYQNLLEYQNPCSDSVLLKMGKENMSQENFELLIISLFIYLTKLLF